VRLFSAARDSNAIKQLRVAEAGAMCSYRRYGVADQLSAGGGTRRPAATTDRMGYREEALDIIGV